jgi:internalin A
LNLLDDQISDISPLKGLKNLTFLALEDNRIVDIKPLANMENLKTLILTDNQIDDISPLANLPNLIVLHIIGNPVVENLTREEMLDVLSGAENLQYLDYGAKPTERVSPMISSLLLTTGTLDVYHLLIS